MYISMPLLTAGRKTRTCIDRDTTKLTLCVRDENDRGIFDVKALIGCAVTIGITGIERRFCITTATKGKAL